MKPKVETVVEERQQEEPGMKFLGDNRQES